MLDRLLEVAGVDGMLPFPSIPWTLPLLSSGRRGLELSPSIAQFCTDRQLHSIHLRALPTSTASYKRFTLPMSTG